MVDQQIDMITALLSEFNTKLRDLEERQRLMRDRLLMIGQNLVKEKEDTENKILEMRKTLEILRSETSSITSTLQRVLEEIDDFARKSELEIMQRQYKIFQPMEYARIKDVEEIIKNIKKTS